MAERAPLIALDGFTPRDVQRRHCKIDDRENRDDELWIERW